MVDGDWSANNIALHTQHFKRAGKLPDIHVHVPIFTIDCEVRDVTLVNLPKAYILHRDPWLNCKFAGILYVLNVTSS